MSIIKEIWEFCFVYPLKIGVNPRIIPKPSPFDNILITPHGVASPNPDSDVYYTASSNETNNTGILQNPNKQMIIIQATSDISIVNKSIITIIKLRTALV